MLTKSQPVRRLALGLVVMTPLLTARPIAAQEEVPFIPLMLCSDRAGDTYEECRNSRDGGYWDDLICRYNSIFDFILCTLGM